MNKNIKITGILIDPWWTEDNRFKVELLVNDDRYYGYIECDRDGVIMESIINHDGQLFAIAGELIGNTIQTVEQWWFIRAEQDDKP